MESGRGTGASSVAQPRQIAEREDLEWRLGASRVDRAALAGPTRAAYGPTLVLTVTLAVACFLVVMPALLLLVHPHGFLRFLAGLGPEQDQSSKTLLYLGSFAVILPLALVFVPRLADRVARGSNAGALSVLTALLAGSLAIALAAVRVSTGLPWKSGLDVLLACVAIWWVIAAIALVRVTQPRPWSTLVQLGDRARTGATLIAGVLVFGTLLVVTKRPSLHLVPLVIGAAGIAAVVVLCGRVHLPRLPRVAATAAEAVIAIVLVLAIVNVVVFTTNGIPNPFFPPGVIQFHHDFLLGPTNQLLRGGGALLVNAPTSQYGVGSIYFLYGWFHLLPIGYGTYGLLDGILTALFYLAAYGALRAARVSRLLAVSAIAVGVAGLLYGLYYTVGALPQQGPLRFGLPMVVVFASVCGARWRRYDVAARTVAVSALGLSSIWAVDTFGYTLFTFAAVTALEVWLQAPRDRRRWLMKVTASAAGACLAAHVILAIWTLAATGHLPDWGQYWAYVHAFLLGGQAGQVVYGFQRFSPALIVAAAAAASAAAIVLLVRRAPDVVRTERVAFVALTGFTGFAIVLFSYIDNRSFTSGVEYVALPTVGFLAVWLSLLLSRRESIPQWARRGGLTFALGAAVLLIASAWPTIGNRFSQSALAHAHPGGRLSAAVHRLLHPPPIDPRAPEGERLVREYLPGKRVIVLLPTTPDLATEILIRGGRANSLFIGDPKADDLVPSAWMPKVSQQIAHLRAGQRLLTNQSGLSHIYARSLPVNPTRIPPAVLARALAHAQPWTSSGWILRRINQRFRLRPIYEDRQGFVVVELSRRG